MEQTIKAIETVYKGYRMRSRIEARWAVVFDALGIDWEYEKEGYELGDGVRYLPDFYSRKFIDGIPTFIEIKPEGKLSVDDRNKMLGFAAYINKRGYRYCWIKGSPNPDGVIGFYFWLDIDNAETSAIYAGYIEEVEELGIVNIEMDSAGKMGDIFYFTSPSVQAKGKKILAFASGDFIRQALTKGRSARFEFGEQG